MFGDEVYQQKTDKDCCCLNFFYLLNGLPRNEGRDSLVLDGIPVHSISFWISKKSTKKQSLINEFFETLSISRDILCSLISQKDWLKSHYENVFEDIKALFFTQKTLKKQLQVQVKVFTSENKETNNEYNRNKKDFENGNIAAKRLRS